jgi:imidazole glycerol phosphate synthase glutamine amidotransferase subunit
VIVGVIDYGAGNFPSVARALDKLGAELLVAVWPSDLQYADAIVLPGVGNYAALIRAIDERDLRRALLDAIARGVPFLGICLGLQALYSSSEEAPSLSGLNLFSGSVRSLPATVKLPHMGWNRLRVQQASQLLAGLSDSDYFYFAHTYAAAPSPLSNEVVATCSHGADFAAVLEHKNILATQFHPEKSGAAGARLLQNFLSVAARMSSAA